MDRAARTRPRKEVRSTKFNVPIAGRSRRWFGRVVACNHPGLGFARRASGAPCACGPSDELLAQDGEKLKFLVAFATGLRREDGQNVGLIGVDQALSVYFQRADSWVFDAFGRTVGADDRVLAPDVGELRAAVH
jgi:hypothetical protein